MDSYGKILVYKYAQFQDWVRRSQMDNLEYLQSMITDQMGLEAIVDIFEKMCQTPVENDMILFETGTFSFTGSPLFYFSLVRQFSNEEDEFYQIHVDVLYKPDQENNAFSESVWNEDIPENIFEHVRGSKAYTYAKNHAIVKVDIYMDET